MFRLRRSLGQRKQDETVTAAGTSAVVVTITGWEDLVETYTATGTALAAVALGSSGYDVVNDSVATTDKDVTLTISASPDTYGNTQQVVFNAKLSSDPTDNYAYQVAVDIDGQTYTVVLASDDSTRLTAFAPNKSLVIDKEDVTITPIANLALTEVDTDKAKVTKTEGKVGEYVIEFNMDIALDDTVTTALTTSESDTEMVSVSAEGNKLTVVFNKDLTAGKTIVIPANKVVSADDVANKLTGKTLTESSGDWVIS